MNNPDLLVAAIHWDLMDRASDAMDAELASAKKKMGVCMKYKSLIPTRAWDEKYVDPFNVGSPNDPSTSWYIAAIAIGMDMRDRLKAFANQNGVVFNA